MSRRPVVLLTRPEGENESLAARLADAGITSVVVPCVRVVDLEDPAPFGAALAALGSGDILMLTSRAGARAVRRALGTARCAAPVAALGGATADACRAAGLAVTYTASTATGAALAAELPLPRGVVMLARSDRAASEPVHILRRRGARVRDVVAYRTEPVAATGLPDADAVVFASPSAVDGYTASGAPAPAVVVAVGTTTATRIRSRLRADPLIAGTDEATIVATISSALGGRHGAAAR
jgi:uroporphyrinogen-III synthase